jgi:hypothetical protein
MLLGLDSVYQSGKALKAMMTANYQAHIRRKRKDFFINYTSKDQTWAEWIAWHLEEADYSTVLHHTPRTTSCASKWAIPSW